MSASMQCNYISFISVCPYGWMDGWMDEWMDEWTDEWMHACIQAHAKHMYTPMYTYIYIKETYMLYVQCTRDYSNSM